MPARLARPFALLFVFTALTLAGAGCTHHGYRDPGTSSVDESVAGRLLGSAPWGESLRGHIDAARMGPAFFPLAVGNHWDYAIRLRMTLVTDAGPQPPTDSQSPWAAEIVGTEHLGTRDYFLDLEQNPFAAGAAREVAPLPFRMRQDRSGLFELDPPQLSAASLQGGDAGSTPLAAELSRDVERSVTGAAAQAAFQRAALRLAGRIEWLRQAAFAGPGARGGGPDPGEITPLRYPLSVGAAWIVRDSPRFARVVEARERLELPAGRFAAWRMRTESELFGPTDRVHVWYSNAGLLRVRVQAESDATDDTGAIIGHLIIDSDQVLTHLRLVDPGRPHALATSTPPDGE